jgi:hypothetical protein
MVMAVGLADILKFNTLEKYCLGTSAQLSHNLITRTGKDIIQHNRTDNCRLLFEGNLSDISFYNGKRETVIILKVQH